ncbi:MAG TPA: hypothetical protein VGG05_03445 [Pseudonocardiaceae bacterium]
MSSTDIRSRPDCWARRSARDHALDRAGKLDPLVVGGGRGGHLLLDGVQPLGHLGDAVGAHRPRQSPPGTHTGGPGDGFATRDDLSDLMSAVLSEVASGFLARAVEQHLDRAVHQPDIDDPHAFWADVAIWAKGL